MSAAPVTIKDDRRELDRILREVGKLRGAEVTIGIHGDGTAREEDGESNPEIGARHEYGIGVPERSFLRPSVQDGSLQDAAEDAVADVATGKRRARVAAERVGIKAVADIKTRIQAGIAPPLSEATVASRKKKGAHGGGLASLADATTPLVDTGQLIQSIQYRVGGAS
jgi:hypothetical protein